MSKTDVLETTENKLQHFVIANSKNLLWIVVGLLIAAGGLVGYSFLTQSKEQKADSAFFEVEKTFKEKQKAKLGTDLSTDFGSVLEGYRKVISDYSGTTAATLASIHLGRLYFDYKKYDEQIGILETAVKTAPNSNIKGLALNLLGVGYDAKGDCKKAIDTWLLIEANGDLKFLAPDAALKIAACQQKVGDSGSAKKTYERITRDYNDDQVAVAQAKKFLKTL